MEFSSFVMTGEVHDRLWFELETLHVVLVHHDDSTRVVDAPVAVVIAVDGRVVLVVAAHGHQDESVLGDVAHRQGIGVNHRLAARRIPGRPVPRSVGQVEAALVSHPLIVIGKFRQAILDEISNRVMILRMEVPIEGL